MSFKERFYNKEAFRSVLRLWISLARIHYPSKHAYNILMKKLKEQQQGCCCEDLDENYARKHDTNLIERKIKFKISTEAEISDAFPDQNHIFTWYNRLSTFVLLSIVVKNIMPWDNLNNFVSLQKPIHCYVIGRLVIDLDSAKILETAMCLMHLSWRLWQALAVDKPQVAIMFLYQRDEILDRQYSLLCDNYATSELDEQLTTVDLMVRRVISYPIRTKSGLVYKLRPNRTTEFHDRLCRYAVNKFIYAFGVYVVVAFFFVSSVAYQILFDINYVQAYPKCSPYLDEAYKAGELNAFSFSLDTNKLMAVLVDGVENFILWTDSGFAFIFPFSMLLTINHDLICYWQQIERNIENLLNQFRSRIKALGLDTVQYSERGKAPHPISEFTSIMGTMDVAQMQNTPHKVDPFLDDCRLDNRIQELHAELSDFFKQVIEVDTMVSDLLTIGFIIWLIAYTTSTYILMVYNIESHRMRFRMAQAALFVTYISAQIPLMELPKITRRSYGMLCSLMAYDKSKFKKSYMRILDNYTAYKRTTFTYARSYPITHIAYLTLIGYTLSVTLMIINLVPSANRGVSVAESVSQH